MGNLDLITAQRQKETQFLKKFLLVGLLSSAVAHTVAAAVPTPGVWRQVEAEDEIEVVVENPEAPPENIPEPPTEPEPTPQEVAQADVPEEPQEIAFNPDITAPPIPLAPDMATSQPVGEDAAAPDDLKPLTDKAGDMPIQPGGGPLIRFDGTGSGFGLNPFPTGGFNPFGRPDGSPQGKPNGDPNGKPGGTPGGNPNGTPGGTNNPTATRSVPPTPAPGQAKLRCLSCPEPKYRGAEGSPRVTYDIAPDGRVINVRLRKSSGNAENDREALEAISKWQFDPKTVPEGGRTNVRVKVTYEEEGSNYQRQNQERRRQQERNRVVEQQRQREAESRDRPAPAAVQPEAPAKPPAAQPAPSPATPPAEQAPPAPAPVAEPVPAPAPEPAPAPVEAAPPPAPVEVAPPPAPVEAPAPAAPAPAAEDPAPAPAN